MIRKGCWFILLFGYSLSSSALEWYAGFDTNYIQTKVESVSGDAKFNTPALSARLGAYIEPQLGLEVYGMAGLSDDEDLDIKLDLIYSLGVVARFETPESEGGKLYFLLGYSTTKIDMNRQGSGFPGQESFSDFSFGGGFAFNLSNSNQYYLNLQALRYYSGDDISISGASLGFRYRF